MKFFLQLILAVANICSMKTITEELHIFFESTGYPQSALAKASGVPASTICNLLKGKRKNVLGRSQDLLRRAMVELTACPPAKAQAEPESTQP